jgi:phosphoribosyl 1,2-cyclic phosphodiesterase
MRPELLFLGTGASGGTPGRGRSRRLESSLLVEDETTVLIDVTRHFSQQSRAIRSIDSILLTHAHADAAGGIAKLHRWWRDRGGAEPIPVYAGADTIEMIRRRFRRLEHCDFVAVRPGTRRHLGPWRISACIVPHARDKRFPTFAWKLAAGDLQIVYASDVAYLTGSLERFCKGASVLVIDGAMWGRQIFTHLTIDRALPELCTWHVGRIVLTQIGKTLPPHRTLEREVAARCERAIPAYDGMRLPGYSFGQR